MDGGNLGAADPAIALDPTQLDSSLPTPLYHQIYLILRDRIKTGSLKPNTVLPGENELAILFDVSRITVKRALNELAAVGLISRHRGRGSIVAAAPLVPIVKGNFFSLIEGLKKMGLETEVRLLQAEDIEAGHIIGEMLDVAADTMVQRTVRVRSLNDEPFSHIVSYIPLDLASHYTQDDLARMPMLELLEQAGAEVAEAEQWISAVSAPPAIAAALKVPTASALLKIERIMRDKKHRPVQLVHAHYRSDRFHYHVKTTRSGVGGDMAPI